MANFIIEHEALAIKADIDELHIIKLANYSVTTSLIYKLDI